MLGNDSDYHYSDKRTFPACNFGVYSQRRTESKILPLIDLNCIGP